MSENLCGWRIIDWGCGVGALVALLQQKGADVVGYDSDLEAIEVGQKQWSANISISSPCDFNVFQGQYDLLLLSHVIEHLPGIRHTVQDLLKFLRPGGFVFVEQFANALCNCQPFAIVTAVATLRARLKQRVA